MATSGGDLRLNGFYCCFVRECLSGTSEPVHHTCEYKSVKAWRYMYRSERAVHALSLGAHGKNWKNVKEL